MQWGWKTFLLVQVVVWAIYLFERRQLKNGPRTDRITFAAILFITTLTSFMNLENLQGPITLLKYMFGPMGRFME